MTWSGWVLSSTACACMVILWPCSHKFWERGKEGEERGGRGGRREGGREGRSSASCMIYH